MVAKAKAPTTHWDYAIGIGGALDLLPPELLRQVNEVAVSTTLATNAIVEGRGQRVGLLLMPPAGDDGLERISHRPMRVIPGQMAIDGTELAPTDLDAAARVARELVVAEHVRAFAVTGYASSVNPAHELAVMQAVKATARPAKARSFFQRTNSETKMQTTNKQVLAYLRRIGSNGGKKTSEAKKAACRANGKKKKTRRTS